MSASNEKDRGIDDGRSRPGAGCVALGVVGALALAAALVALQPYQLNIVRYEAVSDPGGRYLPALLFAGVLVLALFALAARSASARRIPGAFSRFAWALAPLVLAAPLSMYAFIDRPPPVVLTYPLILGAGWSAYRAALPLRAANASPSSHRWAVAILLAIIAALTVLHTRIQINLFDHFTLGHADFGHFTEELKNALAGRGLRSDSFPHTRLGWHFVPLLYLLVPGYALWPSPVYLMACGALFVHLPALPIYFLARRRADSVSVAFLFAAAWLLLPSQSRMVYSNTYGFQWIYAAMPLIVMMIGAALVGRWRASWALTGVCLLCKETVSAVIFGWGVCMALFTPRRRAGVVVAVISVAYLAMCVAVFIPFFAGGVAYQRTELFGSLGESFTDLLRAPFTKPALFFGRLVRNESLHFVAVLLVPMGLLPLRGWRVALAAVPSLILILLLDNAEWLSIRFWHQATVLPVLFVAAVAALGSTKSSVGNWRIRSGDEDAASRGLQPARSAEPAAPVTMSESTAPPMPVATRSRNRAVALMIFVCAAWSHYLYGFSPISKSFGPYADNAALHAPDPRFDVVRRLRAAFPKSKAVLATERLAAHFTDYRRIYTGGRIERVDLIVIDRGDRWDMSGLPDRAGAFASDPEFRLYGEFDGIIVFERRSNAPPVE